MPIAAAKPCRNPLCGNLQPCPRHGTGKQDYQRSYVRSEAQKLYNTAEWRAIRRCHLESEPLCRDIFANHKGFPIAATDVDHIKPHNGDIDLFTSHENLQSLCKSCHSKKTRLESTA